MKIALITGTSGLVGMQLLHQLLKEAHYDFILSLGRRKLALKHQKLIQIEGDMFRLKDWDWEEKVKEQALGGEYAGFLQEIKEKKAIIHAYSSLGTTIKVAGSKERFYAVDHDLVIGFGEWAKSLGASKFLYVSAMGANPHSSIFYNKVKGETEDDLKSLKFDYLGLFRPALLLGNRHEFRLGEQIASIVMKPLVWLKLFKNYRPIYAHQVAEAMVLTAQSASNQALEIITSGQMQDLSK
ncbi:NAD-dependent epimerase/dehydratase family protein [Algoriphagus mannitolivorans]|uniref:NAD-dependent epimerase/dehydratase family protein n=1 Tax=Algoriphagus mannitolivorans TaxID=226504 RepID=UPI00041607C4|nr:NAD-dependent epimerase/dehydratase family protein [Algoriphagus mannitolivorans]